MILEKVSGAISAALDMAVRISYSDGFGDLTLTPGELKRIAEEKSFDRNKLIKKLDGLCLSHLDQIVAKSECQNGFYNLYLKKNFIELELGQFLSDMSGYLKKDGRVDKTVLFDYSSPNIAKPFSVGHLRSTIIGQANLNCHRAIGYKTVGINHLGDWGTQFGKLIVAVKKWGKEEEIEKDPIKQLNQLYVKFHSEEESHPELSDEARAWFKKLEDGDAEARRLWKKCVAWSLKEFEAIYDELGISIDQNQGESFYEDKLSDIIAELKRAGLLKESGGALVVELENLPPALIQKKDGATLYLTRDLAALKYRLKKYTPERIIYHVGNDQALHFMQLEAVAKKMGYLDKTKIVFAGHGLLRLAEGKMSTRRGRFVLLEDLIEKATQKSLQILEEKGTHLSNRKNIARQIAISAIKYADLSQNRKSDIIFSFDRAITMEGNSGPYLQYSYARAVKLEERFKEQFPNVKSFSTLSDGGFNIACLMLRIPEVLATAAENSTPNLVCDFAYQLASSFNKYYEGERIISADLEETKSKMFAVVTFKKVLGELFDILGLAKLSQI